jgi:transcriptional regulator with XRE-family HTH domain
MTGPELRKDRETAGISQEALAAALGVTRPYISQIENRLRVTDALRRRYLRALAEAQPRSVA